MATNRPRIEALEDRLAPAIFGHPWPDASRLTISFVATHEGFSPPPGWQGEVLRAFQAWASAANVNPVVVPDGGQPLGEPGRIQGDPRFGDVRVAWEPLALSSVAASLPFAPRAGTWAGDLLLNSDHDFGPGGYDLFTVALHEAAHVLGLAGQTDDPDSVLFEHYNGPHAGPGDAEVAAIRALYGERAADRFEGDAGNDTPRSAADFKDAAAATSRAELRRQNEDAAFLPGPLAVAADLGAGDVDVYAYRTTRQDPGFTLRLAAREHSLLSARVVVLDADGGEVASAGGDEDIRIEASRRGQYYFRVEAAGGFDAGAYSLELTPDDPDALARLEGVANRYLSADHGNDSADTATRLRALPQSGGGSVAFAQSGTIESGDVDFYRLVVPADAAARDSLDVRLAGAAPGVTVDVRNNRGRTLASATTGADGAAALRLAELRTHAAVYLVVGGAEGAYQLAAQLSVPEAVPSPAVAGLLSGERTEFRGLRLARGGLFHFELQAETAGAAEAAVRADLLDAGGAVAFSLTAVAGGTATGNVWLDPGEYTWRFVGGSDDGSPLAATTFALGALLLSDPIGPPLLDPTQLPGPPEPLWLPEGFFTLLPLLDPYGRPLSPFGLGSGV